ncbi:11296_t:CDS:10 [Paraglomus occultum]|uniref:11296_t:CDS:1 n=1 Tax=Paraglomus occultum TaxID=144539 RepID=A0A9N9AN99_9GLOM|nr:11296_t:CDS:10 [Paraglomus occultum]
MAAQGQGEQYFATILNGTLSPDQKLRKEAEDQLFSAEKQQPNFSIALLKLVANENIGLEIRFAAALFFKNYIKRNWLEESDLLPDDIRMAIKTEIIDILVAVPDRIRPPLSDAVSLISESDFPEKWETLIQQLVAKLTVKDFTQNNAILDTAHAIFKRWRHEFRSDSLYSSINFVLGQFCQPYYELLKATDSLIEANANNKPVLTVLLQSLLFEMKLFYDLNYQDLPPFFEDNMADCMNLLHKYLTYTNPLFANDDDDEAGPLEKIKASICEIVALYTAKFEDVFTMLPTFVETIWTLLTTTGISPKYDILVSQAMVFLTTVVKLERYRSLFNQPETLRQFCEAIVLPNMTLRSVDEELFEMDPIEYIRRDIEGSDSETRRRAATDFVRGLMVLYVEQITQIIKTYVEQYLNTYNQNPAVNWKEKDTAIYLLTSIAAQGSVTKHGVTVVNSFVNVVDWYDQHILPDLKTPIDSGSAILKVDALKYLYTFRNQMSKEKLLEAFPYLMQHLRSSSYVVYTYAAITIERILFMRRDNVLVFNQNDIRPYTHDLLIILFGLIESATTPATLAENDYLMKAVMRVPFTSREEISPYVGDIIDHLNKILIVISKNPSNPQFNHYTFEAIGALQDVTEFVPYVFQVLSLLLECHTVQELPEMYQAILPVLLKSNLWETQGNVPALVRLLQAYLHRSTTSIIVNNQLEAILGIFQKLLASRLNDQLGLELVSSVIRYVPTVTLNHYIGPIFILILKKLQNAKQDKFLIAFDKFIFCSFAIDKEGAGPDYIIQVIDSIQPSLFMGLLNGPIMQNLQKVQGRIERKICAVGMTRLLTKSEKVMGSEYAEVWPILLGMLVRFFEAPTEIETHADAEDSLYEFDLVEDREFKAQFAKLNSTSRVNDDPVENVIDPRVFLAQSLVEANQRYSGTIFRLITEKEPRECVDYINEYMKLAGLGGLL